MSTHSSLDRESFQKLLASAFSLQESGMDAQSLSALLELDQSIATGEPDMDRAMHLVVDRARNVANATGIAIALRRGDQLVYRAGSGCAASYVGRHMTAVLSVSARNEAGSEILRVENARADRRIEAAICRQFEAESLLILPIYNECAVAGVLEVLFSEPHAFQDREMRTYRLMAGLVGEAMSRDVQFVQRKALATQAATLPHAIERIASQMQRLPRDDKSTPERTRTHGVRQVCGAATAVPAELPSVREPAKAAAIITQRVNRVSSHKLRWNLAVTGVVTALVIAACWIAYDRPASLASTPLLQRSNAVQQQMTLPAKPTPSNRAPKAQAAAGGAEEAKSPSSAFKRVRVGPNEIDYVAEDVTIRHFTTKPMLPQVRGGYKEVHVGEDVTVRNFASKPAIASQTRPASAAAQSLGRSLPVSK